MMLPFLLIIFQSICKAQRVEFEIYPDDWLNAISKNGVKVITYNNSVQSLAKRQGFIDAIEGDMLTFHLRSSDNHIGLKGTIHFGPHSFFIGGNSMSFLYIDSGNLVSYSTRNINCIGFNDVPNSNKTFHFSIPRIITIDYTPTVKQEGYIIDLIDLLESDTSTLQFINEPINGKLKEDDNLTKISLTKSYMKNKSTFVFLPDNEMTIDRISYVINNNNVKKREALLLLTIYEGFECSIHEMISTSVPQCLNCKAGYYHIYNDNLKCLSEDTKRNYFFNYVDYLYHPCDKSCSQCIDDSTFCTQCAINYVMNPYKEGDCYIPCANKYYFDEYDDHQCLNPNDNCPTKYPYEITSIKECVSSCPLSLLIVEQKKQCVDTCPDTHPYIIHGTNECVNQCPQSHPLLIPQEKQCYKSCPNEYPLLVPQTSQCYKSCPNNYPFLVQQIHQCYLSCPTNYPLLVQQNKQCYHSCPDVYPLKVQQTNLCYLACPDDHPFLVSDTKTCFQACPFDFPLIVYQTKQCYQSCPKNFPYLNGNTHTCQNSGCSSEFPLLVEDNNHCVKSCNDPACQYCIDNNLYQMNDKCIRKCPNGMSPNKKNECELNLGNISDSEPIIEKNTIQYTTSMPVDEFSSLITDNIQTLIGNMKSSPENHTCLTMVKSQSYDFLLYSPEDSINEITTIPIPKIDLGECENILRKTYYIPDEEKLYIGQIVFPFKKAPTSTNQYVVYNSHGLQLDLSVCSDTLVTISSPINLESGIDLQMVKEFAEKGINIFNSSEPIFNDRCIPFSYNGKDMTVNDRRLKILKNKDLCEEECEMKSINYTSNIVDCECPPKKGGFTTLVENNEFVETITNLLSNYNFHLFLCYMNVPKYTSLSNNYGSWIIGSGIILITILSMFIPIFLMNKIYSYANRYCSNPAVKSEGIFLSVNKYSSNNFINKESSYTTNKITEKETDCIDSKRIETEDNVNVAQEEHEPEELNELSFDEAVKEDKRPYSLFFLHLISEKQIILSTILTKSVFYPLICRLIMLIFTLMAFFFFNGLFFTDEYISHRYNFTEQINFAYIIKNEIEKSVYASILAMLIGKIMIIITSVRGAFLRLIRKPDCCDYKKKICKLIKSIKIRMIILLLIIFVLSLMFLYFLTIFCNIYTYNQFSWIQSTFISIGINMILPIILCLIFGTIKFFGIKKQNNVLFSVGNVCLQFF